MATTAPDDADQQETKRPRFWHLGDDDKRMLYITLVGGLAANLGLVLVIGLSLALLRYLKRGGELAPVIGLTVVGFAMLILVRVGLPQTFRKSLKAKPELARASKLYFVFLAATVSSVLLLVAVGYADGFK